MRSILHKLFPWTRYRREVDQSQKDVQKALEESKELQGAVLERVINDEREKTAKTIMTAQRAIQAAKRICDDAK